MSEHAVGAGQPRRGSPRPGAAPVTFSTLLDDYPVTAALKSGHVSSPGVSFDFAAVKPANKGFKPLVREHIYDLGELAIVTWLQAKCAGVPYVLLPAVIMARPQHANLVCSAARPFAPGELSGCRIGVRSYTQTTAVWLRGILEQEFGIRPDSVVWVTYEDSHVLPFDEPASCRRAAPGKSLLPMLIAGEIDAAIFGNDLPDHADLQPVFPDPETSGLRWMQVNGFVPINHMMVMRDSICRSRPDLVTKVYRLLLDSWRAGAGADPAEKEPFGIERNRKALTTIIDFALRQKIIPRRLSVDELFEGLPPLP